MSGSGGRKNASDEGYQVRQLSGTDQYGDQELDSSWRAKMPGGGGGMAGDVQARELAENDVAREARRKIMEILEEDDPPAHAPQQPARGTVRRRNPGLSMEDLMEGLSPDDMATLGGGLNDAMNTTAVDLMQAGYLGEGDEASELAESMAGRPQAPAEPSWDWVAVKGEATLGSGKKVPVWLVENTSNGMSMQKPFRVQAPAERIAALLNVSGNVNDPRIRQIHEDYDLYVKLSRQLRKAKQLFESGDQDAKKTGQRVAAQLRGVKQRLGIG